MVEVGSGEMTYGSYFTLLYGIFYMFCSTQTKSFEEVGIFINSPIIYF